jgi:predicted GTPase
MQENVIIMGAAGRDFHNFNIYFKNNPRYRVVAFSAAQIPDIDGRTYPPGLAGPGYPEGIPIHPEKDLIRLITDHRVDLVAFSYSDIRHEDVMHKASRVMAAGADFICIGATYTMLRSRKPVIAVCAVRTGCGKSPTTRSLCGQLRARGVTPVVVRHPMPYGNLERQVVQRFTSIEDCASQQCTIEEREEYEHLVEDGFTVFAGVDYEKILAAAEREGDVIIWDGGNNDTPFFYPDVHIVLFDPHRPGDELHYFPGETNMVMADIAVINKVDTASRENVEQVRGNIKAHAPEATVIEAASPIRVDRPDLIRDRAVLVVEDGPTLTHGGMGFGAGVVAAGQYGAREIADPREHAVGSIKKTYESNPHLSLVLPAMGYSPSQIRELEQTIRNTPCDTVLFATPVRLDRIVQIEKPTARAKYRYEDRSTPGLEKAVWERLRAKL